MTRLLGLCAAIAFALSIALSGGADAKVGEKCGGIAAIKCGKGEFCEMPVGTCKIADMMGTCVKVPRFCPLAKKADIVLPVCGCNMKTYGNDCLRQMAKVSKAHDGKCY